MFYEHGDSKVRASSAPFTCTRHGCEHPALKATAFQTVREGWSNMATRQTKDRRAESSALPRGAKRLLARPILINIVWAAMGVGVLLEADFSLANDPARGARKSVPLPSKQAGHSQSRFKEWEWVQLPQSGEFENQFLLVDPKLRIYSAARCAERHRRSRLRRSLAWVAGMTTSPVVPTCQEGQPGDGSPPLGT